MTARENTACRPPRPGSVGQPLPEQSRRRATSSPADRVVRQAQAIDAWVTARREREQALHTRSMTRDERLVVAREVEALRRTHDAIKERCARGLDADLDSLRSPGVTAVVAHRHPWFVDKLVLLLGGHGVTVLACTDNGAEALGAVVAEQPDIVLAGGRLAMMHGRALLAESRLYAPDALLAAQASDPQEGDTLRAAADTVFLRHHPPAFVADALVALRLRLIGESSESRADATGAATGSPRAGVASRRQRPERHLP